MINPKHILDVMNQGGYLKIPFFQRSYVWEEENWKRFLDDMKDISKNRRSYFMGSYIIKKEDSKEADGPLTRLLIDGQQRFTTIILFFFVLYKKLNNIEEFKKNFFVKGNICLIHNHNDREIFEDILNDKKIDVEKYDDNNILKAYNYFIKNINAEEYALDAILYSLVCFTAIELEHDDDEQQVFDTINSLGVKLTVADLIKNHLFSDVNDEKLYKQTWKKTFEESKENIDFWETTIGTGSNQRTILDLFFDSYLTIKSDLKFSQHDLFSTFKQYLKGIKFKEHKHKVIEDIMTFAKLYHNNLHPDIIEESPSNQTDIKDRLNFIFFGMETTTFIPYFLFILKESYTSENERNEIFTYLERYIIRRMICKESNKAYKNLAQKLIRNKCSTLEALKGNLSFDNESMAMPTNKDIEEALLKNLYNNQAKGILYLLEIKLRDLRDSTQLSAFKNYDLEHIMPVHWDTTYWPLIANYSKEDRDKYIQMLGNKTILNGRLNKTIKNQEWSIKKNGNGKFTGLSQHAKGLKTFQFEDIGNWNESYIEKRNNQLYKQICEVWPEK